MATYRQRRQNSQGSVGDPAIVAFQRSDAISHLADSVIQVSSPVVPSVSQSNSSANNNRFRGAREVGFIEKILHSYGFVQCRDREARFFFHFSEYNGNPKMMKIGDFVEFQQSFDKRTGKPIAVSIQPLATGTGESELMSRTIIVGSIMTEAKPAHTKESGEGPTVFDGPGQVTYELNGETFFIPYSITDVEQGYKLRVGDAVEFYIAADERNGNIRARGLKLFQSLASSQLYQGVVCSLKENYGFIERSDIVKEIFFHFSEFIGETSDLVLGDDVEFNIQMRNGKDVAVNIRRLPIGTVVFEDVGTDRRRGRILKTLRSLQGRRQSDPLSGKVVYETLKGSVEIPYGDKDEVGDYTLQAGDIVEFFIATDRRDKLQRATAITLMEDTFKVNGEKRERGFISAIKEGYGFIRFADKDGRMFFHFSEIMNSDAPIKLDDEVEFSIAQDPATPGRQLATRVLFLPPGSISSNRIISDLYTGTIQKEACEQSRIEGNENDNEPGIIIFETNGMKQTIVFTTKSVVGKLPKFGEKVDFRMSECRKTNTRTACDVRISMKPNPLKKLGFVSALKEDFGFIEMASHDKEVFFHFSLVDGDSSDLFVGDEVEFDISQKTSKLTAENVRKLAKGSIASEEVLPGFQEGKVVRCFRENGFDQNEFWGLVQVENGKGVETYPYGIANIIDKRDQPQTGDIVKFQISVVKETGQKRATKMAASQKYSVAKVESLKGQSGILNLELEEGRKLYFSLAELEDAKDVQAGDEVEFVVISDQRTGRQNVYNVRKVCERPRPERLISLSRLKSVGDDSGPRVTIVRQPRGPDGGGGFRPRVVALESVE